MSLLLSAIGFCAQLIAIASIISVIISCLFSSSADSVLVSEDHPTGAVVSVDDDDSDATLPTTSSYCAKSMLPTVITTTISDDVVTDDYSALTIRQLKALCKDRHIKGYSSLCKHELVALLSAL